MKIRGLLKLCLELLKTDVYTGARKEQNLKMMQVVSLFLALICAIMTALNYFNQSTTMMFLTGLLGLIFLASCLIGRMTGNRKLVSNITMFAVLIEFTIYTILGGNDGFAILWTLLVPMIIMSIIGLIEGIGMGLYFQILHILLFWTPLNMVMEQYYSQTFMRRFPILYFCAFLSTTIILLFSKQHQIIADQYQSNLEKAVRDEHNKIAKITYQTIAAISRTVDAKDKYTEEHSSRVAHYSCLIARELGWDEERISNLNHIAQLHDIGKVGINDSILKKPNHLEDEEYLIMKHHTIIGSKIIKELSFLENGHEGALYHHERFDGKGYPIGLKGEDIPITARIIAIADAFDAMNSNRIYRQTCTKEYIIDQLIQGSGTQFDPLIVDVFLKCIRKYQIF